MMILPCCGLAGAWASQTPGQRRRVRRRMRNGSREVAKPTVRMYSNKKRLLKKSAKKSCVKSQTIGGDRWPFLITWSGYIFLRKCLPFSNPHLGAGKPRSSRRVEIGHEWRVGKAEGGTKHQNYNIVTKMWFPRGVGSDIWGGEGGIGMKFVTLLAQVDCRSNSNSRFYHDLGVPTPPRAHFKLRFSKRG